jgi:Predicted transcriptional regulators
MKEGPDIARIAALIGDPARANMLTALMTGRALTASELAREAGITAQTASSHLARLQAGGLVRQRRQGRHKYVTLAGDMGTRLYESLLSFGLIEEDGEAVLLTREGQVWMEGFGIDVSALIEGRAPVCRACLDWSERRTHLAGSLGRALLARIEALGWARRQGETRAVVFTPAGEEAFLTQLAPL